MGRTKKKSTKKSAPPPPVRSRFRLLRGLLMLAGVFCLVLFVGSIYVRARVVSLLHDRATSSSSVVMSRAMPISKNTNIKKAKLDDRLKRMGYQKITGRPEYAGQYSATAEAVTIYFREAQLASGQLQPSQLIELGMNTKSDVIDIKDVKFKKDLTHVWLEPEVISLLGNSSARATTPLRLADFSKHLISAVLSVEDERFYSHVGVDPMAIARATLVNVKSGHVKQGASTITQQLAKNLFFSAERSLKRKLFEAFAALLIETAFTKDQILEFYLNEVFLGQEGRFAVHGFGEASRSFFGKDASELTVAEAATLAGLVKAPSRYAPRRYPERARERRQLVIEKMYELGRISDLERKEALKAALDLKNAPRSRRRAPYFVDYVRQKLSRTVQAEDVNPLSLQIHTGLDTEYQICAQRAVTRGLAEINKSYPRIRKANKPIQAALVAIHPASGLVRAWIGGRDYGENQFDRISQAKRQPGSAFKPFVYLTALDRNLNTYRVARTTSILEDEPITLNVIGTGEWSPENYDKKHRGEVTLREALTRSLNVPTVNLALKVGIENVANTAELFGFGHNLPRVPSLALGAGEVSPLELAQAYAAIVNGGLYTKLRAVESITVAGDDLPLYTTNLEQERIASEGATFVLTNIMQSVIEHGTGQVVRRLGFTAPAAGKTGTSNDERDAWFAGFTPQLLAVVWVGFDDNRVHDLTGSQAAAPIWTYFMQCANPMEPELDFVPPPDVVFKRIDRESGLIATEYCPSANDVTEIFVRGADPVTPCTIHTPSHLFNRRQTKDDRFGERTPPSRSQRKDKSVFDSLMEGLFGPPTNGR